MPTLPLAAGQLIVPFVTAREVERDRGGDRRIARAGASSAATSLRQTGALGLTRSQTVASRSPSGPRITMAARSVSS